MEPRWADQLVPGDLFKSTHTTRQARDLLISIISLDPATSAGVWKVRILRDGRLMMLFFNPADTFLVFPAPT